MTAPGSGDQCGFDLGAPAQQSGIQALHFDFAMNAPAG